MIVEPLADSGQRPVLAADGAATGAIPKHGQKVQLREARLPRTKLGQQLTNRLSTPDSSQD